MEKTGSKHIDDLVKLAVAGNGFAFTALWDACIDQLRAYIKGWLKNLDDLYVDDICSRSFEKAFRQIGTFDTSKSQFPTWLKVIAHNTALDLLDAEKRTRDRTVYIEEDADALAMADGIADTVDSPLDSIISDEDMSVSTSCVEALPELYRDVARMYLIEGRHYKEIAEDTGLELNTVRTRIRRARQLLDKMNKEED